MLRVLNALMDQYSEDFGPVPDPETVLAERDKQEGAS